jgi:ribonuclease HI
MQQRPPIFLYTDGASSGNPGPGGYGVVLKCAGISKEMSEGFSMTTNNRMELKAMICALGYAAEYPEHTFIIYSDSAYVVNSCNSWMHTWALNGWKNSKKVTVENVDLMKEIYSYLSRDFFNAEIKKCGGHTGEVGNELADAAATGNWNKFKQLLEYWEVKEPMTDAEFDMTIEEALAVMKAEAGDNWFPND